MDNIEEYFKNFYNIYEEKCKTKFIPSTLPPVNRILVIGDIHGDFNMLINLLKKGKVINKNNNWIGDDTVIVQVGDQIDSCRPTIPGQCKMKNYIKNDKAEDIKILYYMTNLHNQAEKYGGAVYSLVGNHELMNVDGDMTYVSYKNLIEFGDEYSRQILFKPGNKIANYLACTRKMALIIGSNLFVHAGFEANIMYKYASYNKDGKINRDESINNINKLMALYLLDELKYPNNFKEDFMIKNTSPLWTRTFGNINMSNEQCEKLMKPLEEVYQIGRIYVGHTPQLEKGINGSCNGKIWRTDVGVSNAFDTVDPLIITNGRKTKYRRGQLLEILNDKDINIIS